MCQIIHLEPGVQLSDQQLTSTMEVNPDGFGWMFVDRGQVVVGKEYTKRGDKQFVKRVLDQTQGGVYHFRYRTRGPTSSTTCHPFNILNKKRHGFDLWMMHNGTISGYGNDKIPDSQDFAQEFLRPLYELRLKAKGEEGLVDDPFILKTIQKMIGSSSNVITILGQDNNLAIVNKEGNGGKDFEGIGGTFWASNAYSFNRNHRDSSYTSPYYQGWNPHQPKKQEKKEQEKAVVATPVRKEEEKASNVLDFKAPTFESRYNLPKGMLAYDIFSKLTPSEILRLCQQDPEGAALAITSLLDEIEVLDSTDDSTETVQ